MAETDLQLLTRCANFTLAHTHAIEEEVYKALETSGRTSLVMTLRMLRLQRAVLAIGMFSLFEALLQTTMNWKNAFEELDKYLRAQGAIALADKIADYKLAINVLKHGEGRSHTELLSQTALLEFGVRAKTDFFSEGDVSEVGVLIDVDDKFVRRCAELVEEAADIIRIKEKVWL